MRNWVILGSMLLVITLNTGCNGCEDVLGLNEESTDSSGTTEEVAVEDDSTETDPVPEPEPEPIPEPEPAPCGNDPLIDMAFAALPSASGIGGAQFGCRRFGRNDCPDVATNQRHKGIDLLAPIETNLHSMYPGTVVSTRDDVLCDRVKSHGNRIIVESEIEGETYQFFYCHLTDVLINEGDAVDQGQLIGTTGNTGNACFSDIEHLHLEVHQINGTVHTPVDPAPFLTTVFDATGENGSTPCQS